jgi:hypothetical protein
MAEQISSQAGTARSLLLVRRFVQVGDDGAGALARPPARHAGRNGVHGWSLF